MRLFGKLVFAGMILSLLMLGETTAAEKVAEPADGKVIIAYYFHGDYRCASCTKIENWSHEAIKGGFEGALKRGRLVWKPVNVDKPENKHFVKTYSLYTKSLIIVEMEKEKQKQMRWKNLDKVWQLLRNQEKFSAYVTQEIRDYLEKG